MTLLSPPNCPPNGTLCPPSGTVHFRSICAHRNAGSVDIVDDLDGCPPSGTIEGKNLPALWPSVRALHVPSQEAFGGARVVSVGSSASTGAASPNVRNEAQADATSSDPNASYRPNR
jgi:hypothetical protein